MLCLVAQSCLTLRNPIDYSPPGSPVLEDSPGNNTGVRCHALLQGISPTQGSNPGFPQCRQILYHLSHQGSSRVLKWVAYPLSSRSSWTRNQTRVSCIAGKLFTSWATRATRVLCPWNFPGKNTGVGSHFLLQGIVSTQGSNWVSCIAGGFFPVIWPTR